MSKHPPGPPGKQHVYLLPDATKALQAKNQLEAKRLLAAYRNGDPQAIAVFQDRHPEARKPGFNPTLLGARMLVSSSAFIMKRLSLEKLKKEAKDLVKQVSSGDLDARERLSNQHNKHPEECKLADAQLIVARENGLQSWPKLKAHIESMNRAAEQLVRPGKGPDADLKTLHIRCGNDIKTALETCGFTGDFLEVSNPFAQGPVPDFDPSDAFIRTRTDFILRSYGNDVPKHYIENTEKEIRHVEDTLRHLPEGYDRVVMWYEHDPFDQLSKAYVLAHLARLGLGDTVVECVQIDGFPGIKRFIGIGQLSQAPEALLALWPQRTAVTPAMTAFGARCWRAFTAEDPTALWRLTQEHEAPLPLMQTAMRRVLWELPWTGNGLGLTEHLALDILAKEGPMRPGAIFNLLMTELDPLPFLGDIMLLSILRPLWRGDHAAIEILEEFGDEPPMRQSMLTVTEYGRELLRCDKNRLTANQNDKHLERSVGGVNITAGGKNWCWSQEQDRPVLI